MPLTEVRVQLLVSGIGDGSDGILMYHVYAACLPPYALGIPSHKVHLYCSDGFLVYREDVVNTTAKIIAGALMSVAGDAPENIFPGEVARGEEFFDYFWEIFKRSASLVTGVPLPMCEIRIISGHCAATGGPPSVVCGATVPLNVLGKADDGTPQNASVLTVLDCCLSPHAVQALKNTKYQRPKTPKDAFDNVSFPVACATTPVSFCFRLSWDGHHEVTEQDDPRFAPAGYPEMSEAIGFPVICSVLVAVKSRYIDRVDDGDLGTIFVKQFQSIQRRYYSTGRPSSLHKVPHHNLHSLQSAIEGRKIQPKAEAFNCLLYSRNMEWFTTKELEVSLPPSGREGEELARVIVAFVRQQVLQWHSKNPLEYITDSSTFGDRRAWIRLSKLMTSHHYLFREFTLASSNGIIIVHQDEEYNEDGFSFHDWATACETLPDIVEQIDRFVHDNEGKSLWEYAGVIELPTEQDSMDLTSLSDNIPYHHSKMVSPGAVPQLESLSPQSRDGGG